MCSGVEKKKLRKSPCSLVKHGKGNYAVSSDSNKNITGLILENLFEQNLVRVFLFCFVLMIAHHLIFMSSIMPLRHIPAEG